MMGFLWFLKRVRCALLWHAYEKVGKYAYVCTRCGARSR